MNKKILVVKGIAGLGDRLLSLLVGIMYAKLANLALTIDWRDEFYANSDNNNMFEYLFSLKGIDFISIDDLSNSQEFGPQIWTGKLNSSLPNLLRDHGLLAKWNRREIIEKCSIDISKYDFTEDVLMFCLENDLSKLRGEIYKKFPELDNKPDT